MKTFLLILFVFAIAGCKPGSRLEDGFLAGVSISPAKSTVEASSLTILSGTSTTVKLTTRDSAGNIFYLSDPKPEIEFSLEGGTSTGTFSTITDHHNGTYTAVLSGLSAGTPSQVIAKINGTILLDSPLSITVLPGNYSLALSTVTVSANTVASSSGITATFHTYDTSGNPLTQGGLSVSFSISGGTSTGTFGPITDNNDGTYSATFTGIKAGTATSVRASIAGQIITSALPTVSVTPGIAAHLTFTTEPAGGVIPGAALSSQPVVKITDAHDNIVTAGPDATADITLSLSSGSGSLGGTTTITSVAGVATFTNISVSAQGSGKILTATKANTTSSGGSGSLTKTSQSFIINPPAPGSFTISSAVAGKSQVVLSWGASSNASSYTVKYGTTSGVYPSTASTNATSPLTISSLNPGTTYYFQVEAVNITSATSATAEAAATPLAAFAISGITVDSSNKLKVHFGSSAGASSYTVKFGTTSGNYSITDSSSATSPYEIVSLTGGNTYYVMVTAVNSSGSVDATAEAVGVPINAFTATSLSPAAGSASLVFASATGATSYDALYDTSSHTATQAYAFSSLNVSSPATISGLSAGTTYYYRVRAKNAYGSVVSTNELSGAVYQAFTLSIPFTSGTEAHYSFSNTSSFEITGSGALRLAPAPLTDNSSALFQAGNLSGVQWDNTGNFLRLDSTINNGTFDSTWAPQVNSMVAYWKMDNNFNDSAGSFHATIVGSPSSTGPGKVGSQYGIFSPGNYGSVASGPALANSSFSISAWVRPTSSDGVHKHILGYGTTTTNEGLFFGYTSSGEIRLGFYNNDLTTSINKYSTYDLNRWVHLAATYDAVTKLRTIYRDGVAIASDTSPANFTGSGTMYIGQGLGTNGFTGNLDEFAIWSIPLSATQIQNIYDIQSATYSGLFTSRIMDASATGSTNENWTTFGLKTTIPFYKEIPAVSESSSDYPGIIGNLNTNLAAFWRMNESSWNGTAHEVIDSSGNGNHGTRTEASTTTVGKFGNAGVFTQTKDSVVTSAGSTFITTENQPLTISAWVYSYNIGTGGAGAIDNRIISIHRGATASSTLAFGLGNTNKLMFYTISTTAFISSTATMPKNVWTHVALTYSGTCFQMYINGAIAGPCHTAPLYAGGSFGTRIGSYQSDSSSFNGLIDEMGIWKRTLSANEIKQLYRRGSNRALYQVRTCTVSDCSDQNAAPNLGWKGPDNTAQTLFSELYNTTNNILAGTVAAGAPIMTFEKFGSLALSPNRYFQYRAYLASDDTSTLCTYNSVSTWCSPELQYAAAGPTRYDSSSPTATTTAAAVTSAFETLDSGAFTEVLGGNGCSSGARYSLSHNGVSFYYWNNSNSTWEISSNAATANDATTIAAHINTFPSVVGTGTLRVKAYLQSTGSSQCEIDSLTITGKKY